MDSKELVELISRNGFHPIKITGEATTQDDSFEGTHAEYFAAAKTLGAKAIFFQCSVLEESDFEYLPEVGEDSLDDSDDEAGAELPAIDLCAAVPELSEYKKYLGREHTFLLIAKGERHDLAYYIDADWWNAFCGLVDKAIEKADKDQERIREKMDEMAKERGRELVKTLKTLIADPEFVIIPTQRGMRAYALEKHPELEEMDPSDLNAEIQALNDKILAKGLNKKRK